MTESMEHLNEEFKQSCPVHWQYMYITGTPVASRGCHGDWKSTLLAPQTVLQELQGHMGTRLNPPSDVIAVTVFPLNCFNFSLWLSGEGAEETTTNDDKSNWITKETRGRVVLQKQFLISPLMMLQPQGLFLITGQVFLMDENVITCS